MYLEVEEEKKSRVEKKGSDGGEFLGRYARLETSTWCRDGESGMSGERGTLALVFALMSVF